MSLHYRAGVDLRQMSPQILLAWMVVSEVFERHDHTAWVTSMYRPGPGNLLHGTGEAIDLGLRDTGGTVLPDRDIDSIYAELRTRLDKVYGGQFDVVDERAAPGGPHLHIEFDPPQDKPKETLA